MCFLWLLMTMIEVTIPMACLLCGTCVPWVQQLWERISRPLRWVELADGSVLAQQKVAIAYTIIYFECVFVNLVFILSTLFLLVILVEGHQNDDQKGAVQMSLECHCGHRFVDVLVLEVISGADERWAWDHCRRFAKKDWRSMGKQCPGRSLSQYLCTKFEFLTAQSHSLFPFMD